MLATILCAAIAGVLLLPTASDVMSIVRLPWRRRSSKAAGPPSRFLFLIPAHDEALLIADCVRSVRAQRHAAGSVRVVVVADNCTDDTAERAHTSGAEVLERRDPARRGKPYAVAWALERLDLSAVDGVVILDADAVLDPGFAAAVDMHRPLRGKAIECHDDVRNPAESAITRMAAVLSLARLHGSYRLKERAGLNIPLGDGMCVGVDVLPRPWRSFGLGEDLEVYADLTALGVPIGFAPGARLLAQEASSLRQSGSQRHRWLAGRVHALARIGPALLRSRRVGAHQKLDTIAELSSPGPVVHVATCVVLAAALAALQPVGWTVVTAALAASLARPIIYTVIGLVHDPAPWRALAAFGALPLYAAWRLAEAVRTLTRLRGEPWIRTAR